MAGLLMVLAAQHTSFGPLYAYILAECIVLYAYPRAYQLYLSATWRAGLITGHNISRPCVYWHSWAIVAAVAVDQWALKPKIHSSTYRLGLAFC